MNLKRLGALSIGAIIIGVLVLAGSAPAADQEWYGAGRGEIIHGSDTLYPWASWWINFYVYDSTYYSAEGEWTDPNNRIGRIWGYVNRTTGEVSNGGWSINNTVPLYTGTWSGTFDYTNEDCEGTWTCSAGGGDWWGWRSYP